jgi:chromosome segregation ATPase
MDHSASVARRYMRLCEAYLSLNEAFDKLDQSHSNLQRRFKGLFGYFSTAQQALTQLPMLQQRMEQSDRWLNSLREELQAKEARIGELIANYDQTCSELDSTKTELLGAQALIEKLEVENAQVLERLSRFTSLEDEMADLKEQLIQANEARQQLEAQTRELEQTLGDRDQQIYSLQERLAQAEQEIAFLKTQRDEAQQTAQLATSRAERAEASLQAQTEEIQALQSKLHRTEQQLAMVALNELELLLADQPMRVFHEAEQAMEADEQVLETLPASLTETERILLEIDQFILACSEHMKPQAA